MFQNIGEMLTLFGRTLASLPHLFRQGGKVVDQLFEIGNASLLMACILSVFIGGVITLQTGPVMTENGLANAIGGLRWTPADLLARAAEIEGHADNAAACLTGGMVAVGPGRLAGPGGRGRTCAPGRRSPP